MSEQNNKRGQRRQLTGRVIRNKMTKTLVVEVMRRVQHPVYKKFINVRKKFFVHDETQKAKLGDEILFVESRPLSRLKRWRMKNIVKEAKAL